MLAKHKKALVLAPHTDDGELGCGGTISYLISLGVEVYYAAFSACEQSVLPHFPKDLLVSEVKDATRVLGISSDNLKLYKYEVRTFGYNRQLILDDILLLKKEIQPDLIFIPSLNDIHQDHATIALEAARAFKFSSILSYELPWNNFNFANTCFVRLSDKDLSNKMSALRMYKSQQHRAYFNEDFIRSLAITRGVQIGVEFAEVFEVIRWII